VLSVTKHTVNITAQNNLRKHNVNTEFYTPTNALLYTECPRRNGQNFGRVSLMLKYTDITQNTYIQI